jgi:hypothetical protein
LVLVVAAALSLILRFRHARGPERQQLKWGRQRRRGRVIVTFAFWLAGGWEWALTLAWGYLVVLLYSRSGAGRRR